MHFFVIDSARFT